MVELPLECMDWLLDVSYGYLFVCSFDVVCCFCRGGVIRHLGQYCIPANIMNALVGVYAFFNTFYEKIKMRKS